MKNRLIILVSIVFFAVGLSGCATTDPDTVANQYKAKLKQTEAELAQAKKSNSQIQGSVNSLQSENQRLLDEKRALMSQNEALASKSSQPVIQPAAECNLFPPNAKAGECYARVLIPPKYKTVTKRVLKTEASEKVSIVPAKYEWVEETVLVKEASEVAKVIPAKYQMVSEKVLVSQASEKWVTKPAVFEDKTEKVLVKEAYTDWKKGRGPIEKINHSTGEIMCLIKIPAEYKYVTKRVQVKPVTTEKVVIPAKYKTVEKRVMVEGPKLVKTTIPAEYKTIKVKKVVAVPQEKRTVIPATYATVTQQEKISDGHMEWRTILCETNTTADVVRDIQRALLAKGFNPGPIDGVIGWKTMKALKGYQSKKNLAVGQLTVETLKSLGVL